MTEFEALKKLEDMAKQNKVCRSLIGTGYYDTLTPNVILRNVLQNPGWYTAYTPYQPEISQGRLEALVNFQQMTMDLTGMNLANASMLDEGTAAAEAMTLAKRVSTSQSHTFLVAERLRTRRPSRLSRRAQSRSAFRSSPANRPNWPTKTASRCCCNIRPRPATSRITPR